MCKSLGCGYTTDHSGNFRVHEATHAMKQPCTKCTKLLSRWGQRTHLDNKECKLGARLLQLQAALSHLELNNEKREMISALRIRSPSATIPMGQLRLAISNCLVIFCFFLFLFLYKYIFFILFCLAFFSGRFCVAVWLNSARVDYSHTVCFA